MRVIFSAPYDTRRAFLGNLYGADHYGKFEYDGNFVCSNFLLESLRFSPDLRVCVKNNMSEFIAEEAQMPNRRCCLHERINQDPVILQTLEAPGITLSSDSVIQSGIHHTVRSCKSH